MTKEIFFQIPSLITFLNPKTLGFLFIYETCENLNFRFPFYLRKMWKINREFISMIRWASKIVREWNGHLEIFSKKFASPNRYFTENSRWVPLTRTAKNNNRSNCSTFFGTSPCRCFAWIQRETSRNFLGFYVVWRNVVHVLVHFFHCRSFFF